MKYILLYITILLVVFAGVASSQDATCATALTCEACYDLYVAGHPCGFYSSGSAGGTSSCLSGNATEPYSVSSQSPDVSSSYEFGFCCSQQTTCLDCISRGNGNACGFNSTSRACESRAEGSADAGVGATESDFLIGTCDHPGAAVVSVPTDCLNVPLAAVNLTRGEVIRVNISLDGVVYPDDAHEIDGIIAGLDVELAVYNGADVVYYSSGNTTGTLDTGMWIGTRAAVNMTCLQERCVAAVNFHCLPGIHIPDCEAMSYYCCHFGCTGGFTPIIIVLVALVVVVGIVAVMYVRVRRRRAREARAAGVEARAPAPAERQPKEGTGYGPAVAEDDVRAPLTPPSRKGQGADFDAAMRTGGDQV